MADIAVSVFAR